MLKFMLWLVTGDGDWKARWNSDNTVLENLTLKQAKDEKFWKHETNYVAVGLTFSPFVLDCFGGIGSQAARFLCTLAFWNLDSMMLFRYLLAWPHFPLLIV